MLYWFILLYAYHSRRLCDLSTNGSRFSFEDISFLSSPEPKNSFGCLSTIQSNRLDLNLINFGLWVYFCRISVRFWILFVTYNLKVVVIWKNIGPPVWAVHTTAHPIETTTMGPQNWNYIYNLYLHETRKIVKPDLERWFIQQTKIK